MNKIRIKTLELMAQVLNHKFTEDNSPFQNDDGITYISYEGDSGDLIVYMMDDKEMPEGQYIYRRAIGDDRVFKGIEINGVKYCQYITLEQYRKETGKKIAEYIY